MRQSCRVTTLACGAMLLVATACERAKTPPAKETAVAVPPAAVVAPPVTPPATRGWDTTAGPALLIAGRVPREALVVLPGFTDSTLTDTTHFDLTPLRDARVELFTRAGSVGTATIGSTEAPKRPGPGCTGWPVARLGRPAAASAGAPGSGTTPAARAPSRWSVALAASAARAIPLDSIEGLSSADSAHLAAEVTRLASTLPNDTARLFRGIPFAVRAAWRFVPARGVDAVVADVVRRLNQEASPFAEELLVVAERDPATPGRRYAPAYVERVSGPEETLETSEVLAALFLGPRRVPTLVLGRDYGDGTAYALVERTEPGRWRARWSSAYAGC
jgi:hypothetical protein